MVVAILYIVDKEISMLCPKCKKSNTKVIDSRDIGSCIRRRRECLDCVFRFTTHEALEQLNIIVVKKNGAEEKYDSRKLERGIIIACKKRPVNKKQISGIIDKIECTLLEKNTDKVNSKTIGKYVLEDLKKIDKVAYLRFASVHKRFANPERFEKELDKIKEE